jgi:hypothetical protein
LTRANSFIIARWQLFDYIPLIAFYFIMEKLENHIAKGRIFLLQKLVFQHIFFQLHSRTFLNRVPMLYNLIYLAV